MSVTLRDEDRRAVDLILDRAPSAHQGDAGANVSFATSATQTSVSNERVSAAEKVLKLLDGLPSTEPASDLLRKTLDRIDRRTGAALGGPGALIDASRPVA